jgi:small conductance mechanosensitive channel
MSDFMVESLIGTAIAIGALILVWLVVVWSGARFVGRFEGRGGESAARAATLWALIRRVILIVLVILGVLLVLTFWEVSLTPFLAVGTVFAAAIGFGAQDLVRDFLAGFFILAENQYHIGDTVTLAGVSGTVEDIQLRVTILRDLEGNVHFVPNGQITVASNFTSLYAQPVLDIAVGYGEDVDRAMEVIKSELDEMAGDDAWRDVIRGEPEILGVQALGDSSVTIRARLTTDADERWTVRREALRRVKNRLDAEGIEIPFPQMRIHADRD